MPNFVKEVTVSDAPLLTNDHLPIFLHLQFKVLKQKVYDRHMWLYERADWDGYRQALGSFEWDTVFESGDVDTACDRWTSTVLNIARQFIPNKMVKVRPSDMPFYNNDLRRMKRGVNRMFRKARHTGQQNHWDTYKDLRNTYVSSVKEAKEAYSMTLAAELKGNRNITPKRWWNIVKEMLGSVKQALYPPLKVAGTILTEPKDKAEAFNQYFVEQTKVDDTGVELPNDYPSKCEESLDYIQVTEQEVLDYIRALKINKAFGPDLVSPRMLKEGGIQICPSLARLMNLSLRLQVVPQMWKQANVIPIHKKKDKDIAGNYRPVSLISCVGKLMEKVIFKRVYNFLHSQNVLTPMQSGFRPGDSTINQLIHVYHTIARALDQKKDVRLVFCDISKAFDRVWHKGLLFKLEHVGIRGKLLSWFTNYLSSREQRVTLQGHQSSWRNIMAGVPQGSVLGPLLFIIYINDIVDKVEGTVRLFADDTTLYVTVDNPEQAAEVLNRDLTCISQWAEQWPVKFSPEKTHSMLCTLGRGRETPPLYLSGCEIQNVRLHRHLGMNLAYDLSWKDHIDDMVNRASKRLDTISRLSYCLDRNTLSYLYTSFVRPVLEYGNTLYNNCTETQSLKIEAVQKRAARIVTGAIRRTPTAKMYEELGWSSLRDRREIHCLCLMYKIVP